MMPERHEPTPEDRFRAYLIQAEEAGRARRRRPSRAERWRANAGLVVILASGWGVVVLYVWARS